MDKSIGIFDSGVGGISIWMEIVKILPHEHTIYFADSANAPYGNKTDEEIISLSIQKTKFLLSKGAKIIVVACNTATASAIHILRSEFNVPFIGIEPAFKPAALFSPSKKVGVLATERTTKSELFNSTLFKYGNGVETIIQEGNGLVKLIESGNIKSKQMSSLLSDYIQPMVEQEIDTLVLGCTHYPFLKDQIREITGDNISIIDSGIAVAKQTKRIMEQNNLLKEQVSPKRLFYTNGNASILKYMLEHQDVVQYSNDDIIPL